MEIIIKGSAKEIADFVLAVQNQLKPGKAVSELAKELHHFASKSSESKE